MPTDLIVQIATIAGPAILAFLAGHFHVVLPAPKTPAVPAVPAVPAGPVLLPIGQGGILQGLIIFLQALSVHPGGTPSDKSAAALAVVTAVQPLLAKP